MNTDDGPIATLKRLYTVIPPRDKRRLFIVLLVMAMGAIAEVVTLGAILPFLALISDPDAASNYPMLTATLEAVGWSAKNGLVLPVTILFALAAVAAGAIRVLLTWLSVRFVVMLGHQLATETYSRILHQPYAYHLNRNSSETLAGIQKVQQVTNGVLLSLMQSTIATALGFCIVAALIFIDPIISISAILGFGTIYYWIGKFSRTKLRHIGKVLAHTQPKRIQVVQEGLGGIREIVLDSTQHVFLEKFEKLNRENSEAQIASAFIGQSPRFVVEAAGMVLIAFIALYVSTRTGGLQAGLPILGALAIGSQRLLPLMQQLHLARTRVRANWFVLHEVLEILEMHECNSRSNDPGDQPAFQHRLELVQVAFRYATELDLVIKPTSLIVPKGTRLGIIGKTGSGKSTIMDLIMGLLEPSEGSIRIDGRALDEKTREGWQARIAHVPQVIFLSDATLAENIAFGVPLEEIDMEKVRQSAARAQLDHFVEDLPERYDAFVGERGVKLSGGQRQRVGIARALYKDADVLVFDEATSALDSETESSVMGALGNLGRELTLIIVAHRLSTLTDCDRVIRLEGGHIVEDGSYESVVMSHQSLAAEASND